MAARESTPAPVSRSQQKATETGSRRRRSGYGFARQVLRDYVALPLLKTSSESDEAASRDPS